MINTKHDPVYQAAAEWLMRLQAPTLSFEESLEWQQWMSADPAHRDAFARIEAVWEQPWQLLTPRKTALWRRRSTRLAMAASLLAGVIALAVYTGELTDRRGAGDEVSRTAVGENRSLTLSDGSQVLLGGGTEVRTRLTAEIRHIELLRGEALFKVAKDARRPFDVRAGDATITALGTQFNVNRGTDRVVVAVVEGKVMVASTPAPKAIAWLMPSPPAPAALEAGDQTTVHRDTIAPAIHLAETASATTWQQGQLAFRQEPLRYAIEDVNRYSPKPIVLADSTIGDIRITGTVIGTSVTGWLDGLSQAFHLQKIDEQDRIVLQRAPDTGHF